MIRRCLCPGMTAAVVFLALLGSGGAARAASGGGSWPRFPVPRSLLVIPRLPDYGDKVLLETLSGVLAWRDRHRGPGPMVWIATGNPAYHLWRRAWLKTHPVPVKRTAADQLFKWVGRFHRAGLVKGYVLYRGGNNISVNLATSLCAPLDAVAVNQRLQSQARAQGLKMLADAQGKTFSWLLRKLHGRFSRTCLGLALYPHATLRDEIVAANALCTLNAPGGGYQRGLTLMRPGGIVIGWGTDEFQSVSLASQYALRVVAADFCSNLPVLSSGPLPRVFHRRSPPAGRDHRYQYNPQRHYVAFVLSDGDNLEWAMAGLVIGRSYWANPRRGDTPFGWGVPGVDLAQVDPYVLDDFFHTASGKDSFVQYANGYFYLDQFGRKRGGWFSLIPILRRTNTTLARLGLHVMTAFSVHWANRAAREGYRLLARNMPAVRGVLAIQFAPYAAGRGKIIWVRRRHGPPLPIISAFSAIWRQPHNSPVMGSPRYVAALLNHWAAKRSVHPDRHFAWIIVHAWSRFDMKGHKIGGYGAARACARLLNPSITVVTPSRSVDLLVRAHQRLLR